MTAEAKLTFPALALHIVGAGEKFVEIFNAERDVQELRFARTRPENVVMIASSFGAEEHPAITCNVGDAEFEAVAIEGDGLIKIAATEYDVVNQLGCCFLIPGSMLVPSNTATRCIDLIFFGQQWLPPKDSKADPEPKVIGRYAAYRRDPW